MTSPRAVNPEAPSPAGLRFLAPSDATVFVGPKGGRLRRSNFRNIWVEARDDAGLSGLHLHDLRHTENTTAAATGVMVRSTRNGQRPAGPTSQTATAPIPAANPCPLTRPSGNHRSQANQ
jgi:integrase